MKMESLSKIHKSKLTFLFITWTYHIDFYSVFNKKFLGECLMKN